MSKKIRIVLIILSVLLVGGIVYWQLVKKNIIKFAINFAVSKATDDEYYVKYDSSYVDEAGGNAGFYNIVLQNDSARIKMLKDDTTVDRTIVDIKVKALEITGLDVPGFRSNNTLTATTLRIVEPVVKIISTGKTEKNLTKDDSLALYKRITGKFKSIKAAKIEIINARILFANRLQEPHTRLEGVHIGLQNLRIDKNHDYNNIVSYLVKDVEVDVSSFIQKDDKKNVDFTARNLKYSAKGRFISIEKVTQEDRTGAVPTMIFSAIKIAGINTQNFIHAQKIQADSFLSAGGSISMQRIKRGKDANGQLDIENDFFTRAQIKNIVLGSTDVTVVNKTNGKTVIKGVKFTASNLGTVTSGTNLQRLLAGSNFMLSAEGTSLQTNDGLYDIIFSPFTLTGDAKILSIKSIKLKPRKTWQQFVGSLRAQTDLYDVSFSNVVLSGFDINAVLLNNNIVAKKLSMTPNLKIYNDLTVPFDNSSKIGKYPHQQLVSLGMPIFIEKVVLKNGDFLYRERGGVSKQTGDVHFSAINATIENVTNMKERIARNGTMTVRANARFLNKTYLQTTWQLPLTTGNATFTAQGNMGSMDATALNPISKPLGMAAINSGHINGLTFYITGNDLHSRGTVTLKYEGLSVHMLKSDRDSTTSLQKKGLLSTLANRLLKTSNPSKGKLRTGEIDYERDVTKSFFNLLWKSVLQAVQKIVKGKEDS